MEVIEERLNFHTDIKIFTLKEFTEHQHITNYRLKTNYKKKVKKRR